MNNTATSPKNYILKDANLLINETGDYVLRVKDLPEQEKPREKLLAVGSKGLTVTELIAVLLGVGTKKEEVLAMSSRILREYGEKTIQHETNPKKLATALGIPITKASQIVVAFELGRRFFASESGKPVFIRNSTQAYEYVKDMAYSKKEQLRGLYLNSRHELIHDEVISVGSLTANVVHPREVFHPAILNGAVAIIVAHNHPSGDPEPTPPDIAVTDQLQKAGDALGIGLLDHLVVTKNNYNSIVLKEHLL